MIYLIETIDNAIELFKSNGLNFCELSVQINDLDEINYLFNNYVVHSIIIDKMIIDGNKKVKCLARINLDISYLYEKDAKGVKKK